MAKFKKDIGSGRESDIHFKQPIKKIAIKIHLYKINFKFDELITNFKLEDELQYYFYWYIYATIVIC